MDHFPAGGRVVVPFETLPERREPLHRVTGSHRGRRGRRLLAGGHGDGGSEVLEAQLHGLRVASKRELREKPAAFRPEHPRFDFVPLRGWCVPSGGVCSSWVVFVCPLGLGEKRETKSEHIPNMEPLP